MHESLGHACGQGQHHPQCGRQGQEEEGRVSHAHQAAAYQEGKAGGEQGLHGHQGHWRQAGPQEGQARWPACCCCCCSCCWCGGGGSGGASSGGHFCGVGGWEGAVVPDPIRDLHTCMHAYGVYVHACAHTSTATQLYKNSQCRQGTSGCRPQRAVIRCPRRMSRYFAYALQFGDPPWMVSHTIISAMARRRVSRQVAAAQPMHHTCNDWAASCLHSMLPIQLSHPQGNLLPCWRRACSHATCRVACMMATLVVVAGAGSFGRTW